MQHFRKNRRFGRVANQRRALLRSLMRNLILAGRLTTTEARAKEMRPHIERLITHAKRGTIAGRRLISSRLGGNEREAKKLIDDIAPQYKERAGGYTRIIKHAARNSDSAQMAMIEFV